MTYDEQIEAVQESLASNQEELRASVERVRRAVREPLAVTKRIRERPAPWVFGAALLGLWLGVREAA